MTKSKVYAAEAVYIDPVDCDSIVAYKITRSGSYLNGSVKLTDCSHSISWYFNGNPDAVTKIECAIKALTAFKDTLVLAQIDNPKKRTKKEKEK